MCTTLPLEESQTKMMISLQQFLKPKLYRPWEGLIKASALRAAYYVSVKELT